MKYLLLMYAVPDETKAMSTAQLELIARKHEALRDELTESGELINGAGLALPDDTRTLRRRDGTTFTGDGPLIESTEQFTAYYLVECADQARASAIADKLLDFHVTAVEVRYIHDSTGLKSQRLSGNPQRHALQRQ